LRAAEFKWLKQRRAKIGDTADNFRGAYSDGGAALREIEQGGARPVHFLLTGASAAFDPVLIRAASADRGSVHLARPIRESWV
jgi:hypothetical protein